MNASGNPYYGILTFVSAGGYGVSKDQLVKSFGSELTEEIISIGAVKKISKTDKNNPIYVITEYGRKRRDQ